jgi:hypothetical protein
VVSLYFAKPDRRYALELVNAYATEVAKRVLPVFDNIGQEADDAENQCWLDTGNDRTAFEQGFSVYSDLIFVREQVTGLAVAGLYQLWERLIKKFIVNEYLSDKPTMQDFLPTNDKVLKADFSKLEKFLKSVGWSIKKEEFYPDLDRLRLVANVVKHGDGPACKVLLQRAPDMFFDFGHSWPNEKRGASHLLLKREDFPKFADAARRFFERFPERLPPLHPPSCG